MYIQSGRIKANQKDIQAMQVFLEHARADMSYGGDGTYTNLKSNDNQLDERELAKGMLGLENINAILQVLCEKWE